MVSHYDPNVVAELPPFAEARAGSDRWRDRLELLAAVILHHDLADAAVINMLHSHVAVRVDERMLRRVVGHEAVVRPTTVETIGNAVACLWKTQFDRATGTVSLYPLEYLEAAGAPRGTAAATALAACPEFFAEFGRALADLGRRT